MALAGIGLYSVNDAARLVSASPRELRRWVLGYSYKAGGAEASRFSEPLWTRQLDAPDAIGFNDLLEVRIVKEFVKCGVQLNIIRAAIAGAKALFGTNYPLTFHRFLTDGKRVFHEAAQTVEENPLTDMAARQVVIDHVIRPALHAGIEYAPDGTAERWYPLPRSKAIVLDPAVGFGAPILTDYGIPVETISAAVAAEKNAARVAKIFGISRSAVDQALRFEKHLAA